MGRFGLILSPAIIDEYRRVGQELANQFPSLALAPIIDALITMAQLAPDEELPEPICSDPDDDKFLAAAVAGGASFIVSGDKALRKVHEYHGVRIVTACQFYDAHLRTR